MFLAMRAFVYTDWFWTTPKSLSLYKRVHLQNARPTMSKKDSFPIFRCFRGKQTKALIDPNNGCLDSHTLFSKAREKFWKTPQKCDEKQIGWKQWPPLYKTDLNGVRMKTEEIEETRAPKKWSWKHANKEFDRLNLKIKFKIKTNWN